jgi:phospholipid/cholesterol/gamma-HCH transport system substrate-binding protein
MKRYRYETVAGIFVLIGLVCVGYLAVKLGRFKILDHNSYPLYARFSSVSGLRTGNSVEMLGIQIGEVAGFRLDQDKQVVMVEFKIREDIKVYEDAIASIKTLGLIGDRYVSLDAGGSGSILKPGGVITQTQSPPDLSDLIGKYAFGDVDKQGKEKK